MALFSRGIKRIYLSENHNLGRNTVPEELPPFIDVLPPHSANTSMRGTGFWEELYTKRNIMGAILVGFPGMAGSGGFKSHSWDSNIFEYIRVNGREAGSITMTAGLLGEYGIPVAAIIGDEAAAREMRLVDPNIIVVTVKKMAENGWVELLPPESAHSLITQKVTHALDGFDRMRPFRIEKPARIEFKLKMDIPPVTKEENGRIHVKNRKVLIEAKSFLEAYYSFWNYYLSIIF